MSWVDKVKEPIVTAVMAASGVAAQAAPPSTHDRIRGVANEAIVACVTTQPMPTSHGISVSSEDNKTKINVAVPCGTGIPKAELDSAIEKLGNACQGSTAPKTPKTITFKSVDGRNVTISCSGDVRNITR